MKLHFFCVRLLIILCGGSASVVAKGFSDADAQTPQTLVKYLFVDRVSSDAFLYDKRGAWDLYQLLPVMSLPLRKTAETYIKDYGRFVLKYGEWQNSIPPFHSFLIMSNFDPLTLCDVAPKKVSFSPVALTSGAARFRVSYRLFGSRRLYSRGIDVVLSRNQAKWSVDEVFYDANAMPALEKMQSLSGMLNFLSAQIRASELWARQHKNELRTQSQMLKEIDSASRGSFDSNKPAEENRSR
jgi:hypothetical protein